MKKITLCLFLASLLACNDASEESAATDTAQQDSALHMEDGTVNADTIDRRTDARQDKGLDTLQ